MALYKAGKRDAAKQALGRALELNPQFAGADEARRVLAELG
jgi:Tfp pilus assembly protein PilF